MKTIIRNYEVKQHSTFLETIKIIGINRAPTDISSWTIYGALRGFYESSETTFILCTKTNPILGEFTIGLPNLITSSLTPGQYIYDITALIDVDTVQRLYSGTVTVTEGIINLTDPDLIPTDNIDNSIFIDGGVFP